MGGACFAGYCQLHCTSARCCGRGQTGVQRRAKISRVLSHLPPFAGTCLRCVPVSRRTLLICLLTSEAPLKNTFVCASGGLGKRRRLSSSPPAPREPTYVRLALLKCKRMWLPGGFEHTAFHGRTGLLQTWNVGLLCVQETRAPAGAVLPVDQPSYAYDDPQGLNGCDWVLGEQHVILLASVNAQCFLTISVEVPFTRS